MSSIPDVPPRPSNQAAPAPNLAWPPGKRCAVFNSFDVDSESAWIAYDVKNLNRLVTMSFGGYEARVGVPRSWNICVLSSSSRLFSFQAGWWRPTQRCAKR